MGKDSPHIMRMGGMPPPPDALEPLLKPLHPRVFDIFTPLDYRKALAAVLREIGRM